MPDWDNTESRESDEDATWRDLVARFETPTTTVGPVPGPIARTCRGRGRGSSLRGGRRRRVARDPRDQRIPGRTRAREPRASGLADLTETTRDAGRPREERGSARTRGVEGIRGFDDEGVRGAFDTDAMPGATAPDVIQGARERRAGRARHPGAEDPGTPGATEGPRRKTTASISSRPRPCRCPSWTRSPRAPGRRCSAGRVTWSWRPRRAGRYRVSPRSARWPRSSQASPYSCCV